MATKSLGAAARALLERPVLAHVVTLDGDGSPHVTPVWVDVEGDDVVLNTADGRAKARNVRADPRVAVSVTDPDDPFRVVSFQGRVTSVSEEGADAHIDQLAKKYLGVDSYPMRQPGERRLKVTIRPERVLMQPADA